MAPGGAIIPPTTVFDNMHQAAINEGIMVVKLDEHVSGPGEAFPDPVTGEDLYLDDLFSQSKILLTAMSLALPAELLNAQRPGIPITGIPQPPPVPPISAVTVTTTLS